MKISKRTLIMVLSLVLAMSVTAFGTVAYMTDRQSVTNTFTIGNVDIIVDETDADGNPDGDYPDVDVDGDGISDDIEIDEDGNIIIIPGDPNKDPIVIKPNEDGTYPPTDVDGDGVDDEIKVDEDGNIVIVPGDSTKPPIVINPEDNGRVTENEYKLIPGKIHEKDPRVTVKAGSEECYVRMRVILNNYAELQAITGKSGAKLLYEFVEIGADWTLQGDGVPSITGEEITYEFRYKAAVDAELEVEDVILQPLFKTFTVPGYFTGDDLKKINDLELIVWGDAIQTESFANETDAWKAFGEQYGE